MFGSTNLDRGAIAFGQRTRFSSSLSMAVGAAPEDWDDDHQQEDLPISQISFNSAASSQESSSPGTGSFFQDADYSVYEGHDGATPLPTLPQSAEREDRIDEERKNKARFVFGDELFNLRQDIEIMQQEVEELIFEGEGADSSRVTKLETAILKAQQSDAEFVYSTLTDRAEAAEQSGLHDEAAVYKDKAMAARKCLPQFDIEGLWVGKYGEHGYEMINVTYVGDTLVAYKVTGDQNVPKGEITFTADLSPNLDDVAENENLAPIELTDVASRQWGTKFLPRFNGKGHVAAEGFVNQQWMEGQLILVGDYFSFAWVPIGHQIFFGRPSAELTIKMLRESQLKELSLSPDEGAEVANMRLMALRSLEATEMMAEESAFDFDDTPVISSNTHDYFNQEGCFE
jgi:hypothetical protein